MPTVTARIDGLRAQYGTESFDARLRRAMDGEPVFHAREDGVEFGTPVPELAKWVDSIEDAFGSDFVLIGTTIQPGVPSLISRTVDPCVVDRWIDDRRLCDGCDGSCIGKPRRCSEERDLRAASRRKPSANELWAAPEIVQPDDLIEDTPRPDEQVVMVYLGR